MESTEAKVSETLQTVAVQTKVPASIPAIQSQAQQVLLQTAVAAVSGATAAVMGVIAAVDPEMLKAAVLLLPPWAYPLGFGAISVWSRHIAIYSQKHTVIAVDTALNIPTPVTK